MGRETERMMDLTPEQQFEVEASTMSREQLYNLAKRLWCDLDEARGMRMKAEFYLDCRCSLNGLVFDEHHNWTDEQWRNAAKKELSHAL
jgi:hypothetical protein